MTDPTRNERVRSGGGLAAAARDSSMEKLEDTKGQLAEGAERVAAAVARSAENLEADGDETVSGFGRSLAGLMRQLAGGLRERDIEQFARELGTMARRNPGVFLAGSVALGFGVARFFKARPPRAQNDYAHGRWQDTDENPDETLNDESRPSSSLSQSADRRQSKSRSANRGTSKPQQASSGEAPSGVSGEVATGGSDGGPVAGGNGS